MANKCSNLKYVRTVNVNKVLYLQFVLFSRTIKSAIKTFSNFLFIGKCQTIGFNRKIETDQSAFAVVELFHVFWTSSMMYELEKSLWKLIEKLDASLNHASNNWQNTAIMPQTNGIILIMLLKVNDISIAICHALCYTVRCECKYIDALKLVFFYEFLFTLLIFKRQNPE